MTYSKLLTFIGQHGIAIVLWGIAGLFLLAGLLGALAAIFDTWREHELAKQERADEASRRSLAAACHLPRPWKEKASKGFGRKVS